MPIREYQTGALRADERGTQWERGGCDDESRERPDPLNLPPSDLDGDLIDEKRLPTDLPEE